MSQLTDPYVISRFFSKVEFADCWLWRGPVNSNGYGRFPVGSSQPLAHRVSYEFFMGPIPAGRVVCHSCDNRKCVNPKHLWLGTQAENLRDAVSKGRMVSPDTRGEKNGNTRLTTKDAVAIKQALAGGCRQKDLARSFGVDVSTISNIKLGKTWSHINA